MEPTVPSATAITGNSPSLALSRPTNETFARLALRRQVSEIAPGSRRQRASGGHEQCVDARQLRGTQRSEHDETRVEVQRSCRGATLSSPFAESLPQVA
jgi:hypothetical protein